MYKHILVCTDFVKENNAVVDRAAKLVKEWKSKLTLMHVVEPLPSYGYAYVGGADIESQIIDEAKKKMKALGKKLNVAADDQIIEVGPTKVEILRTAKERDIDLIVVGSHGRHGLGVLLGSTANAILHGAECDVLTVRLFYKD